MSFIDEFKRGPAAWLAQARAEPEEPLVGARHLSLSFDDAERLEEAVSGKSPSYDRFNIAAGSAELGRALPETGSRATGGRPGALTDGCTGLREQISRAV